jgi:hypothetical protein
MYQKDLKRLKLKGKLLYVCGIHLQIQSLQWKIFALKINKIKLTVGLVTKRDNWNFKNKIHSKNNKKFQKQNLQCEL